MGVLNVTPDSFSDGGLYLDTAAAVDHGLALASAGAALIDVGGESTRPGAAGVSTAEEQRRVLTVVRELTAAGVSVSIDTLHADTAEAAIAAGATTINDVSGGEHDPAMRSVAAEAGVRFVAMHWRGIPSVDPERSHYVSVVREVRDELARLAEVALQAGIAPERLVLDPGLGFDKTSEQGWQLLRAIPELAAIGYPVLIGVSRKRMLTETLAAGATLADRDAATALVSAFAAEAGAWGVRVHDVASTVRALTIQQAWHKGAA